MAQQTEPDKMQFDLRKFRSWQEHRKFRMDKTKTYFVLANPKRIIPEDYLIFRSKSVYRLVSKLLNSATVCVHRASHFCEVLYQSTFI